MDGVGHGGGGRLEKCGAGVIGGRGEDRRLFPTVSILRPPPQLKAG